MKSKYLLIYRRVKTWVQIWKDPLFYTPEFEHYYYMKNFKK